MVAPIILLNKVGQTAFQIDFTTIGPIKEDENAQLNCLASPYSDAGQAIVFDALGPQRTITFQGSRIDQDINNGSAMSNSAWILAIRALMNGNQDLIGPFRLVKQLANSNYWPNETVMVKINQFTPEMGDGQCNTITFSINFMVGAN